MTISGKIAYHTFVQTASKVISTGLSVVAIAIIARYLGSKGFGQYTTIFTFVSFFAITADFGLTLISSKMASEAESKEKKGEIISALFTVRLISAAAIFLLIPLAVYFTPYDTPIKIGIVFAYLSMFFVLLSQIFVGLFQQEMRTEKIAFAEIANRLFIVVAIILVAKNNLGIIGVVAASNIAAAINFIILFYFASRRVRIRLNFNTEIWRKIFRQSWPLAITIFFNLIYLKTDTLTLSLVKSQEEVGIYGAAYKVIDVLVSIPYAFCSLILPILSQRYLEGDFHGFEKIIQKAFDAMATVALPMVVGTIMLSEPIMVIVAGQGFEKSGIPLSILVVACGSIFIGAVFAHVAVAIEKQKMLIPAYIFTAITTLAGYLFLIPKYSYYGAAAMTVYSESIMALLVFLIVKKQAKFSLKLDFLPKIILASAVMALFIFLFKNYNLFIIAPLAVIIYFSSLIGLGGKETRKLLSLWKN